MDHGYNMTFLKTVRSGDRFSLSLQVQAEKKPANFGTVDQASLCSWSSNYGSSNPNLYLRKTTP